MYLSETTTESGDASARETEIVPRTYMVGSSDEQAQVTLARHKPSHDDVVPRYTEPPLPNSLLGIARSTYSHRSHPLSSDLVATKPFLIPYFFSASIFLFLAHRFLDVSCAPNQLFLHFFSSFSIYESRINEFFGFFIVFERMRHNEPNAPQLCC